MQYGFGGSRRLMVGVVLTVPSSFVLDRRDVSDRAVQPDRVVPVDPGDDRGLELMTRTPRAVQMYQLGLERSVECLGHRVVIGVADGADRCCDACFDETLTVTQARVLRARIGAKPNSV